MLVYYLANHGEKFKHQDLNLDFEWEIHYDTEQKELIINKNADYISGFFGEHIETVSALIGPNGAGKSSLLEYIRDRYFKGLAISDSSILITKSENTYQLIYSAELFPKGTIKINGIVYTIKSQWTNITLDNGLKISANFIESKEKDIQSIIKETRLANDHAMICFDNNWKYSIRERELDQEASNKGYDYYDFSVGNTLDTVLRDKFVMPSRIANPEDVFDITFDNRFDLDYLHREKMNDIYEILKYLKEENNRTYLKRFLMIPEHMYILYDYMDSDKRANNFLYHDENILLRYEKKEVAYLIEQKIYDELRQNVQERISLSDTMKLRTVESYFTDIDLMIPYKKIQSALRESELYIKKLDSLNLLRKLFEFHQIILTTIEDYIPAENELHIDKKVLKDRVKRLTRGYIEFIKFIDINLLQQTSVESPENITFKNGNPDDVFKQKVEIPKIKMNDEGLNFMLEFLKRYKDIGSHSNFLYFNWHDLSSGESNLLKLLAVINNAIQTTTKKNVIILLDEAETTLHPEWQRKYIQILTSNIERIAVQKSKKIQIIMTTHSPVITSDIPHYAINYIVKENGEHKIKAGKERTLGSNIHSLYLNNFYLESTMGQFVKEKIDRVLKKLNEPNKTITSVELEEINQFTNLIGDPLIKKVLTELTVKKILQDKSFDAKYQNNLKNLKVIQEFINQQILSFEQERNQDE
ncbi:AAA family ATPase [Sporosarcina sp. FA15]|uniref:AAA family ATPase n=1 Tax=Sporosarcina sp. FA15 TaxID=3413031 RepID=UPI003F656A5E